MSFFLWQEIRHTVTSLPKRAVQVLASTVHGWAETGLGWLPDGTAYKMAEMEELERG